MTLLAIFYFSCLLPYTLLPYTLYLDREKVLRFLAIFAKTKSLQNLLASNSRKFIFAQNARKMRFTKVKSGEKKQ